MAEAVEVTHVAKVLGVIPPPPDLGDKNTEFYQFPLEQEWDGDSKTTLIAHSSNLHPSYNGFEWSQESVHLTGVRFGDDNISYGRLTIDGRAPADPEYIGQLNNDSGEWPLIYALSEDTYLVQRAAGMVDWDWSRPTTKAWIIRVSGDGTPVIVDELMVFGPSGYNPVRKELIFINPTQEVRDYTYGVGYGGVIPSMINDPDILGCFGYSVSVSGFGSRIGYPDPPTEGWTTGFTSLFNFLRPGLGVTQDTVFVDYRSNSSQGEWTTGLYNINTASVTDLLYGSDNLYPFISSTNDDKGDVYAGPGKLLAWWWGQNKVATTSGSNLVIEPEGWNETFYTGSGNPVTFHSELPEDDGEWTDRTYFGNIESRWAVYARTVFIEVDPPYTSFGDFYDRNPQYHQYWTREVFIDLISAEAPDEAAWLAEANKGSSQGIGNFVGFQSDDLPASTTHWAVYEPEPDDYIVWRMLGRSGSGQSRRYFTVSAPTYAAIGSDPAGSVTIVRWDPTIPDEVPVPVAGVSRRPVRMYPRMDSRAFQGFR